MTGDVRTAAVIVARISFVLVRIVDLACLFCRILFSYGVFPDVVSAARAFLISVHPARGKPAAAHEIVVANIVFTAI
jgi:hypothetical protein